MTPLARLKAVPRSVLALAALAVAGIYLFVTAPPDLDDAASSARTVPVETLFRMLDAENASIRAIYTAEIVGPGQKAGLKYHEDWKKSDVHAGPLPALLLRETANRLQQREPDLSLFLGSAFPIEPSNRFKGAQQAYFEQIERDRKPRFFLDASTGRYTAMFADVAKAEPCVKCHNGHPKSPRKDWKLDDVMGATTWSFARKQVSTDELVAILAAYRASAIDAYASYLRKTASFAPDERPQVGGRWPSEGRYVPDLETFRRRVEERNSIASLNLLLQLRETGAPPVQPSAKSTPAARATAAQNGGPGGNGATAAPKASGAP